jgi:MFS family permease
MLDAPLKSPDTDYRSSFRLLFASVLVVGFGNTMLFAVLPPLTRTLGLSDTQAGLIFSLSALIWVFSSPYWGRESDRRGRKPIIVLGLLAYAVSMALIGLFAMLGLFGWVTGLGLFIALTLSRAIFGSFGSATSPASQAYIADQTSPDQRTNEMASLSSAWSLGAAIGPAIAAALAAAFGLLSAEAGLLAPIYLTAAMAALGAFAISRWLPETEKPPSNEKLRDAAGSLRLALDRRVSGYLIYGLGLSTAAGVLAQTFTFYTMDRLNLTDSDAASHAAMGFMGGAFATLAAQSILVPKLKLNTRSLMVWGAGLIALGVVVQAFATNQELLVAARIVQGFGFGLASAGYSGGASLSVRPDEQGPLAGVVVGTNGAGFIFAPLFGGWLYENVNMLAPLILMALIAIAMMIFARVSRRLKPFTGADGPGAGAETG